MQAPVMSQAMLCQAAPSQAPRDWLGLLISLRKYWARQWVRCCEDACLAKPMSFAQQRGSLSLTPAELAQERPAAGPDLYRLLPPIVLLSVILHLEERLPEDTAAIAAAQLLPIVERVLEQESARVPADFTLAYTVELLVIPIFSVAAPCAVAEAQPAAAQACFLESLLGNAQQGKDVMKVLHVLAAQMLCTGLASGTALPFLLGSAQLITCALQSTEALSRLGAALPCMSSLFRPTTSQLLGHLALLAGSSDAAAWRSCWQCMRAGARHVANRSPALMRLFLWHARSNSADGGAIGCHHRA